MAMLRKAAKPGRTPSGMEDAGMPVRERCPETYAEWNSFDDRTGEPVVKRIYADTVVKRLAEGMTSYEIADRYQCPLAVVEHCIMVIPQMVVWRDKMFPGVCLDVSVREEGEG